MSIKKIRPKRSRPSSNLIVRMSDDRMSSDRMMVDRGVGSISGIRKPSVAQSDAAEDTQKGETPLRRSSSS